MMKWLFSILICLSAMLSFAQIVSLHDAEIVARRFLIKNERGAIEHIYTEIDSQQLPLFYVFNSDDGFAVISGERNCIPLLAYSYNNQYQHDDVISPARMWFDHYAQQVAMIRNESVFNPSSQQLWRNYLENLQNESKDNEEVVPFVTSQWDQDNFYNFYCPRDLRGTSNGRAVTGCVATAMAQILYYFRWPDSGNGLYSYEHDNYGTISANFGETNYHFDEMTDKPTTINPAISLLCFHLGVAVDMVYGANSSGMYNHKAAFAMRTYFKYSPATEYVYRDSTNVDWDSLMVSHLDRKIPLYYAGWSVPNIDGHGFVCDGYQKMEDERYYYHFNFGWSGHYDGYFYTESLSPGGSNFNLAQEVIANGYPDSNLYNYPPTCADGNHTITSVSGSFEDCSGPMTDYSGTIDYTWRVSPEEENVESIDIEINFDIANLDTLFIIADDPNVSDRIITNENGSLAINMIGDSFSVRLKTTGQNSAGGFKCCYNSNYEFFCSGTRLFTEKSDFFDDGSGDQNYNNCARCRVYINPTSDEGVQFITLQFHDFETEEGEDILYVYDNKTPNLILLDSFSGRMDNFSYTYETRRLLLIFETSAKNTFSGWSLSYFGSMTDIVENSRDDYYSLYPNPTQNRVTVKRNKFIEGDRLFLYSSEGRQILSQSISSNEFTVDLSSYSSGLYFMYIRNSKDKKEKIFKIIKE